jgi:hypothetical protein
MTTNAPKSTTPPKSLTKKSWVSITTLSLVFVGAYFVLRALPDAECVFLHFEEIVNANGEVELCAVNHAGFIDLSRFKYPIKASFRSEALLEQGRSGQVELHLETSGGMSIAAHELAVTHTEKMHVMIIDASLEDYHHVHPRASDLDGIYLFDFEPARAGNYRVFTEIVPQRSRRQAIALSEIEVAGEPGRPQFASSKVSVVDGIRFELGGIEDTLRTGRKYRLELLITNPDGERTTLETVMGAKGHMVAFDAAINGFAHMHPVDSILSARTAAAGLGAARPEKSDDLAFVFNVPNPGWYRLFAQIQVNGEAVFGRFDLKVE